MYPAADTNWKLCGDALRRTAAVCAAQRESNGQKLDVDNCSAQLLPDNQEKLLSTVYWWATVPLAIRSEVVYLFNYYLFILFHVNVSMKRKNI